MDKRGIALLLIAVVFAAAAGGGVYLYLKGMPAVQAQAPETVPVVVARKDVTFGTTLAAEHLRVADFPAGSVPEGSYPSVDSVLSHTTKVFVVEGEPILASKLSAIGGGLSVRIPPNMRAMSLSIDDVTGVSGFVLPGDRVDALVTIERVGSSNTAITKTVLQNIEVLAAGTKTETRNNRYITVQTVTVLVDPEGAEKLALGVNQGKVHLSLRNPVDHELVEGKSTDTRTVLGLNKPRRTVRRTSKPKQPVVQATKKDPVVTEFTVIRDGKILRQESPTAVKTEEDKDSGSK